MVMKTLVATLFGDYYLGEWMQRCLEALNGICSGTDILLALHRLSLFLGVDDGLHWLIRRISRLVGRESRKAGY